MSMSVKSTVILRVRYAEKSKYFGFAMTSFYGLYTTTVSDPSRKIKNKIRLQGK